MPRIDDEVDLDRIRKALESPSAKKRSSGVIYIHCPMHDEKTPSFVYRPKSRSLYCYGCHSFGWLPEDKLPTMVLEGQLAFSFEEGSKIDSCTRVRLSSYNHPVTGSSLRLFWLTVRGGFYCFFFMSLLFLSEVSEYLYNVGLRLIRFSAALSTRF